jgi:hypothetical protein
MYVTYKATVSYCESTSLSFDTQVTVPYEESGIYFLTVALHMQLKFGY